MQFQLQFESIGKENLTHMFDQKLYEQFRHQKHAFIDGAWWHLSFMRDFLKVTVDGHTAFTFTQKLADLFAKWAVEQELDPESFEMVLGFDSSGFDDLVLQAADVAGIDRAKLLGEGATFTMTLSQRGLEVTSRYTKAFAQPVPAPGTDYTPTVLLLGGC
jgi:hypothetical protein